MSIQNLCKVNKNLSDYLTFYHELQIPHNKFFDFELNRNKTNNLLIVSSPSRMGNHLVLSVLDNHPELPRLPGEDGFLSFSFQNANYDFFSFIQSLCGDNNFDFITHLAANGSYNRWLKFKQLYKNQEVLDQHAGLGEISYRKHGKFNQVSEFIAQDYEGLVFDINYDAYADYLKNNLSNIRNSKSYNEIFQFYLHSIRRLDFKTSKYVFDSYIIASGMRTQLKWICNTYENTKILSSIRSFDSYAISHIRSRYRDQQISAQLIQEAWEHWYHKVIDLLWLKINFPNKIGLLIFEDLIDHPKETHKAICKFLGIEYHINMQTATVFGIPVKGNSSNIKGEKIPGVYYKPKNFLDQKYIPKDYYTLWNSLLSVSLKR